MIWKNLLFTLPSYLLILLASSLAMEVAFAQEEKKLISSLCGYETSSLEETKKDNFVGRDGEIGICQILPETARTLARWRKKKEPDLRIRSESLEFAGIYIQQAIKRIKRSCRKYSDRAVFHAYNRGLGAIRCNPDESEYIRNVEAWILFNETNPWWRKLRLRGKHEFEQRLIHRRRRAGWNREDGYDERYWRISIENVRN